MAPLIRIRRRRLVPLVLFACCVMLMNVSTAGAAPTTRPTSQPTVAAAEITGRVIRADGQPGGEVVVYLESADPGARFDPPTQVARMSHRNAKFLPPLVVICAGQSVDFSNDEAKSVDHNVFSRSPVKTFDLGLYKPGAPGKVVQFDQPGSVRLFCSIHRYMDGLVYVCPTPFFTVMADDGRFTLSGVPPGKYHVKTWQRSARVPNASADLTATAGGHHTIDLTLGDK